VGNFTSKGLNQVMDLLPRNLGLVGSRNVQCMSTVLTPWYIFRKIPPCCARQQIMVGCKRCTLFNFMEYVDRPAICKPPLQSSVAQCLSPRTPVVTILVLQRISPTRDLSPMSCLTREHLHTILPSQQTSNTVLGEETNRGESGI